MPFYNQISDNQGNVQIFESSTDNSQVEPLGGVVTVADLMDRFPDTIYQRDTDSHLYLLLQALCGDAGAGYLKRLSYAARLKNESELLVFKELDTFYQQTLRFPRLSSELYDLDPDAVIPQTEWDDINNKDLAYRQRVMAFFQATRIGNSPEGMQAAAFSGSGIQCEIIENYRYIFDLLSDDQSGIQYSGSTNSVSEYIVSPRLIDSTGAPDTSVAYEMPWIDIASTNGSDPNTYVTATYPFRGAWVAKTIYALDEVIVPTTPGTIVFRCTTAGTTGTVEPTWASTGITVSGTARFTAQSSSDQNVRSIWKMDPKIERNMVDVMDRLRPVGAFMSLEVREQHYRPLSFDPESADASSERFYTNRLVTGNPNVRWPAIDGVGHYIEAGIEHEIPKAVLSGRDLPVVFHTIQQVHAYTDLALNDSAYNDGTFYDPSLDPEPFQKYRSEHIGAFNSVISSIYTFLKSVPNDDVFSADKAVAIHETRLILEGSNK